MNLPYFSPRIRKFPKIRRYVFRQPQGIPTLSNGAHFALCQRAVTLKIETIPGEGRTTIKLIGRIRAEHLDELQAQIAASIGKIELELGEVSLVDADAVRFLIACESQGIELLSCSAYIREWIVREQESSTKG